jgi:hypothetical protein
VRGGGPLGWSEEVAIEWLVGRADCVVGGEVNLFTEVCRMRSGFGAKLGVA